MQKITTTLILIHVIDLKKVIYEGTKIGMVLFSALTFLFWASPPCQDIHGEIKVRLIWT